ncbi:hypothetical protein [Actinoplanes sp. NPDC048796]|uniref:hypothetical protein n=1 Tax=unclassified Actinoplanes TaxID=2626549 RepID=UPI0033E44CDB
MTAAIDAGQARKPLLPLIERVNADHTPVEIRSPANAKRLAESVEQWRAGR